MKRIMSLFVVLFFVAGCGGASGDSTSQIPENSPDFEEIEIPTSFMSESGPQSDAHLVPEEMIEMVIDALTIESARTQLIRRIREASPCANLESWTDEEIWDDTVDQFNFDSRLHTSGNSLEDAIRNLLAHDLPLDAWEEDYSRPEWSEFEAMYGVAWVALAVEIGRC